MRRTETEVMSEHDNAQNIYVYLYLRESKNNGG